MEVLNDILNELRLLRQQMRMHHMDIIKLGEQCTTKKDDTKPTDNTEDRLDSENKGNN